MSLYIAKQKIHIWDISLRVQIVQYLNIPGNKFYFMLLASVSPKDIPYRLNDPLKKSLFK